MDRELNIICQACKRSLGDDDNDLGSLWVSPGEITVRQAAVKDWERQHLTPAADGSGLPLVGFKTMLSRPDQVCWHATHAACDDPEGGDAYAITSRQLRTWADLVEWTSHLMAKAWINDTNWATLLGEVAGGRSPLITRADRSS
ncbi:hypothetical protein [Kitasatospora sp. NPDC001683]